MAAKNAKNGTVVAEQQALIIPEITLRADSKLARKILYLAHHQIRPAELTGEERDFIATTVREFELYQTAMERAAEAAQE